MIARAGRVRRGRPGASSFAASLGIHAVAILLAWGVASAAPPPPVVYQTISVELVSPPGEAPEEAPPEELVVERPEPDPPAEETPAPVVEEEETRPEPEPERPTPRQPTPEPTSTREPEPERPPGGADVNVRMEGLRRDYPAYYQNIITQINRCLRGRSGERHSTEIGFVIERDGTVSNLEVVRPSGSVEFDYRAMGAVECAGRPGRIGPLPEGYPWDRLPIRFSFDPSG